MMRQFTLFVLLLLCLSDTPAIAVQYAYQVNFTDKHGTVPLSDSASFLSARALARRANQGIIVDSTDLPVTRAYVDSVLHLTGGKIHETSRWLNLCVILIDDSVNIHALDTIAFVSSTRFVGYYTGILHKPTAGATSYKTTSDAAYYGNTWPQTALVNGNYLHDLGFKGNGMMIAVMDQGFIATNYHRGFDSMRSSGRLVDVHNFAIDTTWIFDYDNHGTEVLSTMAGYVPDTFVGSAPLASYALYVTEAAGERPIELLNLLCGTERADSAGVDVISCSLGYNEFDDPQFNFNYATDFDGKTTVAAKAANIATRKGMLFVASAGNEGQGGWHYVLTPGDADSALTIGNVDVGGSVAAASGYGPNAAGQVKPDVCGMGQNAAVFSSTGYSSTSGTSLSTPEIAGFAACLWQASPHSTPAMIKQAIRLCASQYASPGDHIGYGIANFQCAAAALNIKDTPAPSDVALVTVVPNPTHNELGLSVSLTSAGPVTFRVMDMAGRSFATFSQVFSKGVNGTISYDISTLPAGMYVLKATTSQAQHVTKFVKY
jgi:serine protease AprX